MSNVFDGFNQPPLRTGAQLNLDILEAASGADGPPGRDLTVTVRL
jgi:hypothetical protein